MPIISEYTISKLKTKSNRKLLESSFLDECLTNEGGMGCIIMLLILMSCLGILALFLLVHLMLA